MVEGPLVVPGMKAYGPEPAGEAADVPRDAQLSWRPADTAVAHDLYLGTAHDDVVNANRANPLDVAVSQGQVANTYDPGLLVYGIHRTAFLMTGVGATLQVEPSQQLFDIALSAILGGLAGRGIYEIKRRFDGVERPLSPPTGPPPSPPARPGHSK